MSCECEFCTKKPDGSIKSGVFVELEFDRALLRTKVYATCEDEAGKVGKISLGSSTFL